MTSSPRPSSVAPADGIRGFDGLRALAVLTVLSYHVALARSFAAIGPLAPVMWELKGGVAIFFVISGTLLYLPYARALRDRESLPGWRAYTRRRAVRILPAYWVALSVLAVAGLAPSVLGSDAWRYYTLSQIYDSRTLFGGLGVAWSLCVEVTFYAMLPLFAWLASKLLRRTGARRIVLVQLGMIALAATASLVMRAVAAGSISAPVPDRAHTLMVTLPGMFDWFAIGMSLAILRSELEAARAARTVAARLGRRTGWCVFLSFAAFLAATPAQHGDLFLSWYGLETHIAIGAGAGLLALAVIVPRRPGTEGWPLRLLSHPVTAWLGTVSYGVYLWHLPVVQLLRSHFSPSLAAGVLEWLLAAAGSVCLAALSWYFLERPAQRRWRSRGPAHPSANPGRLIEIDAGVHSTLDPLNSPGVAVDHLA